jgi:hypothetical protein
MNIKTETSELMIVVATILCLVGIILGPVIIAIGVHYYSVFQHMLFHFMPVIGWQQSGGAGILIAVLGAFVPKKE